jgi:hypothetical protein
MVASHLSHAKSSRRRRGTLFLGHFENRPDTNLKQGLLGVAQKIDDSALGVAQKDAFPVGEQVQTGPAGAEVGEAGAELLAQQLDHPADALKTEAPAAQVAKNDEFGKVRGGVETAMTLAGGHYDSLLVPPLQLTRGETGAFGDLTGCEALIHCLHTPDSEGVALQKPRLRMNTVPQYV